MRSGEIPVFALAVVFALAFLIFHSRRESASAFAFSKRQRRAHIPAQPEGLGYDPHKSRGL